MEGNNCKATEKNKRETLNCESLEQVVGGTDNGTTDETEETSTPVPVPLPCWDPLYDVSGSGNTLKY